MWRVLQHGIWPHEGVTCPSRSSTCVWWRPGIHRDSVPLQLLETLQLEWGGPYCSCEHLSPPTSQAPALVAHTLKVASPIGVVRLPTWWSVVVEGSTQAVDRSHSVGVSPERRYPQGGVPSMALARRLGSCGMPRDVASVAPPTRSASFDRIWLHHSSRGGSRTSA